MIVLATDFGTGPYTAQLQSIFAQYLPGTPVITLFDDLPRWDIKSCAYLLPAYTSGFPAESVFVVVVDPGVGSDRRGIVAQIDDHWFVGPDNGVFEILMRRSQMTRCWFLDDTNAQISASFHGRDVFAPAAADIALGKLPGEDKSTVPTRHEDWPKELYQCVYVDHFGNVITGVRANAVSHQSTIVISDQSITYARTFSDVAIGEAFWYENSNGLIEIAVNQGRANELPGVNVGSQFNLL